MPINKNEVSFTYNLDNLLEDVPEEDREDAAFDAGNAALDAVKSYMEGSSSPVKGEGKFKALSKDYKKLKQKVAGNTKANLKLFGDLDESMEVDADDNSFTISIREDNVEKAYNHNTKKTKENPLPKRQFIPDDTRGETFKRSVVAKIKEEIAKYKKPVDEQRREEIPSVEIGVPLEEIFRKIRATKREQEISRDVSRITIKDIT